MNLDLDSSVTVAWHFDDERNAPVDAVLAQVTESGAMAPSLWRLEVANALNGSQAQADRCGVSRSVARRDRALAIEIDETDTAAWSVTLRQAAQYQLTLYEAAYLELAQRRGLPLASLDQDLREAGAALGITLLGM